MYGLEKTHVGEYKYVFVARLLENDVVPILPKRM
jgi:hypothetical protein